MVVLVAAASAQSTTQAPTNQVTLSLDRDLITFVKWAGGALGLFLIVCGWVFGVDVFKTRAALLEAREDIANRREAIRGDHQALLELKDRLQKLGAVLEDEIEKAKVAIRSSAVPAPPTDTKPSKDAPRGALTEVWEQEDRKRQHIREVLAASEFQWSTIGTVAKKTGLPRPEVETLAQSDPLIQIGQGQEGARLLRLKEFNFSDEIGSGYSQANSLGLTRQRWLDALRAHAQYGKRHGGKVLGGE